MKNKFITVILIILMLVPSVVAIVNYSLQQGGKADVHNTIGVELCDFYENVHSFDRESENEEMVDYFINTISNASEVSALPTSIEMGNYYTVTVFTTANKDGFGYKFYYTTNAADCYFMNGSDGKAYKIAEKDAEEFIKGAYSACLYENGIAPTLTLSGKDASPDEAVWNFKNSEEEYVQYDCSAIIKNEVEKVTLEGGLSMNFSIEPDSFSLKITDKGSSEVIFEDDYSKLAGLSVTKEMDVAVEGTAKWYEDNTRNYYGEQTFRFDATFGAPAQFYAGVTDIQVGEFICVTGVNVNDPQGITFQSEPDINYTPVFFKDKDTVQTLIPFSWNLSSGDYVLTFSYGGSTQQINISVGDRSNVFREKTLKFADTTFGADSYREKAEAELREIAKKQSETRYWDNGETLYYDDDDLTFVLGYGHTYTVEGTDITFRNTGVDFSVEAGTELCANLGGEIIFADFLDYSGYTVVIEHGYGLKTWYAHMGSISVKVGDIVKKGDLIGEAGESGFTNVEGVHIGMTIYDTPICTYAIWKNSYRDEGEKGIVMYEAK